MSEEVKFSENIDFQYPMKQACAKEVEQFCDVVPHGGGRVIRCLQVTFQKSSNPALRRISCMMVVDAPPSDPQITATLLRLNTP
jgi:hypothetical protein